MAVPTGQGVGRALRPPAPRVEHARPFFDEFWRFGLDKGTSIVFGQATRAAGAAAARVVEGVFAVRATHPVLHISRTRALATYRCVVCRRVAEAAEGGRAATARAAAVARLDECSRATTGGR
ncbi:hypothetical protein Ctob_014691 [Chrysochromulina tobinii]|uniref:Uncharacterized protein n=1 Tax=Chrysochromulina tobinii TaxID=1460289 RepID=A0A0M0LPF1_9EUKA|nr:hypothetical protein Ctob_014691 [Chrysochromulina tobinii]|eukprot:KOO52777.1 hypothetical protein Ctob_014691 [Chrysochromulina sp. CCMP291]